MALKLPLDDLNVSFSQGSNASPGQKLSKAEIELGFHQIVKDGEVRDIEADILLFHSDDDCEDEMLLANSVSKDEFLCQVDTE